MTQVIIPTAGLGSRLGTLTNNINKALLPVGKKPAISYIIDWYPKNYSFVIALGYKGQQIKNYIEIAYPNRKFTFVDVSPYVGLGSGLGYTLKCCKKYIKENFFFHTNDCIVLDKQNYKSLENDTIFASKYNVNTLKYRSVKLKGNIVSKFIDKTTKKHTNLLTYLGIVYIKDFKKFKKYLSNISYELGESDYLINQLKKNNKIQTKLINKWYDVGDIDDLRRARKDLSDFDNLPKDDEFIYFNENKVIKFFVNKEISKKRVARTKILKGFVPNIDKSRDNFYSYKLIEGQLLSKKIDIDVKLNNFLNFCKKKFWKKITLNKLEKKSFNEKCFNFYYNKTLDRISSFYQNNEIKDSDEIINNIKTEKLSNLISRLDWESLSQGYSSIIHGDFHFENILYVNDHSYKFIDWRHDFGGIVEYGDIYYDLAKLYHGILVDHGAIRNNMYNIEISKSKNVIDYEIYRKESYAKCEEIFLDFLTKNKYSIKKTKIITALIYLNIATLHHQPYSFFLYYLGKKLLNDLLNE